MPTDVDRVIHQTAWFEHVRRAHQEGVRRGLDQGLSVNAQHQGLETV